MSQIYKQGQNWIIIDFISNLDLAKEVVADADERDFSEYTSAKGPNSVQKYIINPSWMPSSIHKQPEKWPELRDKWKQIVQSRVVEYGLMPQNWKELHACCVKHKTTSRHERWPSLFCNGRCSV